MKQLRVLTGSHAGATLSLVRASYRIGGDEDDDIHITDWTGPSLLLATTHEGEHEVLTLASADDDQTADAVGCRLLDFTPRGFGDVVLCAGPAGVDWPSDLSLLAQLMGGTTATSHAQTGPTPGSSRRPTAVDRHWLKASGALVSLLALVGLGLAMRVPAADMIGVRPLVQQVQLAIQQAGLTGVEVLQADRQVIVQALLANDAEASRLRAVLRQFGSDAVIHRYAAVPELQRAINDALAAPGLQLSYRGQGVFAVDGQSSDLKHLKDDARRVSADLAPWVRAIEVAATQTPSAETTRFGAALVDGDLQYVQTADGAKHILQTATVTVPR